MAVGKLAAKAKPVVKAAAAEEVDPIFGVLDDYEPESVKDDFEILKGKFVCQIIAAGLHVYEGQEEALEGHEFFKIHSVIADGQPYAGRHFFKPSIDVTAAASQYKAKDGSIKTGKSGAQKAADVLFTLGITERMSSKARVIEACESLLDQFILIRAGVVYRTEEGGWSNKSPYEGAEGIQTVKVLGLAEEPTEGEAEVTGSSEF